jgi:hypothetical protein
MKDLEITLKNGRNAIVLNGSRICAAPEENIKDMLLRNIYLFIPHS